MVSSHVNGISIRFTVDQERVIFGRVPHVVGIGLDFDSQSVWCGGCHLVHSFQADPEVSTWKSEPSFVVGPVEIEVCGIVQLLMYDDPPIDGINDSRMFKCRDADLHLINTA